MKKIIFAFIMMFTTSLFASNSLRIVNVRQTWWGRQGTIERAVLSIHPKGSYVEQGLYLTISDRGSNFSPGDSLEIQFEFELPKESYLTDLWLWVEDSLMRALIMDRWTATDIYEGIVKRRRDPALLTHDERDHYIQCNLKIFPLTPGKTRRIKLTFLTPANWTHSSIHCNFPVEWLKTSNYEVTPFYILFWPDNIWQNPSIPQATDLTLNEEIDDFGNKYLWTEMKNISQLSSLQVSFDNPMKNGIFLNTFSSNQDHFYELCLMPNQLTYLDSKFKKTLFLVDFLPNLAPSDLDGTILLNNLQLLLTEEYALQDSFNFIFTKFQNTIINDDWIPAEKNTIISVFDTLDNSYFSEYSSLPSLFAEGINFIQQHDNQGDIILISNSTDFGEKQKANNLAKDILNAMNPRIPIYVVDLNNNNYPYFWIDGRKYYGNEYFFYNISRFTSGEYYSIRQHNCYQILYSVSSALGGFFSSFDVYTTMSDGFTYSRFNLFQNLGRIYLNKPIFQIGRYNGNFPFHIEISGEFEGETIFNQLDVLDVDATIADSITKTIWIGHRLDELKTEYRTNSVISEMIDLSLENRILTDYTAFLALEPNDTVHASKDLYDESQLVSVEDIKQDTVNAELEIKAFPNPFNTSTTLQFSIPSHIISSNIKLAIYNIRGQLVKMFAISIKPNKTQYNIKWDGLDDQNIQIASGIYIANITINKITKSIRLLYLK